jgi:hypothetical protein
VRALAAGLFDGDAEAVALVPSAGYGLTLASRNLPLAAGDSVLVLADTFPSNLLCWQQRCIDTGARLHAVQRGDDATAAVLAALDAYAAGRFGAAFTQIPADQQDAVLRDLEADTATGFAPSASAFFETVLEHALEGMFGDPYHGGNARFVGWDLIEFPGIKLSVPSVEQRLGVRVKPAHKSTTDYAIFRISKKKG